MNFSKTEPGQCPAWYYVYKSYVVILHVVVTHPKTPSDLFLNSHVGSYILLGTAQSRHK